MIESCHELSLRIADFWDACTNAGKCSNPLPNHLAKIIEHSGDDFTTANFANLVIKAPQQKDVKMRARLALQSHSTASAAPLRNYSIQISPTKVYY